MSMNEQENKNYYDKISETYEIEEARQRKLKRRRYKYISIVAVLVAAFLYLCYQYLFKITTIEVVGNSHYTTEELLEAFGVDIGEKLFSYDKGEKEELLLEKYPYLSECKISRTIPEKVTITVEERTAAMYTYISGKYIIFDEEAFVLEISEDPRPDLRLVNFNENIVLKCIKGQKMLFADEKTGVGLKRVYNSVKSSSVSYEIKSINVESRFDYYLTFGEKYNVYLGDSQNCDAKLLFLCGIIEKLYEEDKGLIDVSELKKGSFIRK